MRSLEDQWHAEMVGVHAKGYMGHADISTTMLYVHHVPKHDDADALGSLVEHAVAAPAPAGAHRNSKSLAAM